MDPLEKFEDSLQSSGPTEAVPLSLLEDCGLPLPEHHAEVSPAEDASQNATFSSQDLPKPPAVFEDQYLGSSFIMA